MVRKDPLNERGPKLNHTKPKFIPPTHIIELHPIEEYSNLWDTVVNGLDIYISIIERFSKLKIPGKPLLLLKDLQKRIEKISEV